MLFTKSNRKTQQFSTIKQIFARYIVCFCIFFLGNLFDLCAQKSIFLTIDPIIELNAVSNTKYESVKVYADGGKVDLVQFIDVKENIYQVNSENVIKINYQNKVLEYEIIESLNNGDFYSFYYAETKNSLGGKDYLILMDGSDGIVCEFTVEDNRYISIPLDNSNNVLFCPKKSDRPIVIDDLIKSNDLTGNAVCIMNSSMCMIDILCFYEEDFETLITPTLNPITQALLSVGRLNAAFIRSKVKHRANIVGIYSIEDPWFDDTPTNELLAIQSLVNNTNSLVNYRCKLTRPDLIVFFSNALDYGTPIIGLSTLNATILNNCAVVGSPWNPSSPVFPHEIGHLLGADHQETGILNPGIPPSCAHEIIYHLSPEPIDVTRTAHTLMWAEAIGILNFSNPNVKFYGELTGSDNHFNACVVQNYGCQASTISNDFNFPPLSDCKFKISGFSNCNGVNYLQATFKDGNSLCQNDGVKWEYSLDGITFQLVYPNNPITPINISIPFNGTFNGGVFIRATVYVNLAPHLSAFGHFGNCPSKLTVEERSDLNFDELNLQVREEIIFPNPAKDQITIKQQNFEYYSVLNVEGKVVKEGIIPFDKKEIEIDVSNLTSETYILHLWNYKEGKYFKFLKI
jgi:Secretion system C-terminal sorting domain